MDDDNVFTVAVRFRPGKRSVEHGESCCTVSGKRYFYDAVFGPETTQDDLYEKLVREFVRRFLADESHDVTVLVYGQTASGKTHTVDGLVERCCRDLAALRHATDFALYEIYCEKIRDLLDRGGDGSGGDGGGGDDDDNDSDARDVKLYDEGGGAPTMRGLTWKRCRPEDIPGVIARRASKRSFRATRANQRSSRAHTVVDVRVAESRHFRLIDLAGSERTGEMGSTGKSFEEGRRINQSLMYLRDLIFALSRNVPRKALRNVRGSKLTRILAPSFFGESRVLLLACCRSCDERETASTLHFAENAKRIKRKLADVEKRGSGNDNDAGGGGGGGDDNDGGERSNGEKEALIESLRRAVKAQSEMLERRAMQHERLKREVESLRRLQRLILHM